ncbi:hypothetical protein U1763_02970 [Sphingomonas sp. LB2R24]
MALCPVCKTPHHYSETTFPLDNDFGSWLIRCAKCPEEFIVQLQNPRQSDAKACNVVDIYDDIKPYGGSASRASEGAVHNLDLNRQQPLFDYASEPIYRCSRNGENLEQAAFASLTKHHPAVASQLNAAMNMYLARSRMRAVDHAVVGVPVSCNCGEEHRALFYHPFKTDGSMAPAAEAMLLADVSGADLSEDLTGIFSKTYLMNAIEKLIVRWRLFCDQIVIAVPFFGHGYSTEEQKLQIWERLLGFLDPDRTFLLTRPAAYKAYKAALKEAGIDYDVIAKFGLENRMISAGNRKQNFHAKFYAGVGERSEILSGSANLVSGPSFENASFAPCAGRRITKRYLDPLGVEMPAAPTRARAHLTVELEPHGWVWDTADGPAPALSN